MESHAEIGYRILSGSDSPLLELAAMLAWTHHERFDGTGYPRALRGEEIPIEGRIAAVADVFDAVTHDRVYRPRVDLEDGIAIISAGRGGAFDPAVVDAFFACLDEISAIVAADDGATTRVFLVEDHEAVRQGIELILRGEGCEVVGSAPDAAQALSLIEQRRPQVALIDVGLPGDSGIELTRRLSGHAWAPRILLYTGLDDPHSLREALAAGAAGIVLKAAPPRELVAAIREVALGGTYVDPRLGARLARASPDADRILTAREREVLGHLATGLTSDQVAAELVIAPETVRTHIRNAMTKLAARTRPHAVAEALRRREIDLDDHR